MLKASLERSLEIARSSMFGRKLDIPCRWGCRAKGKAGWIKRRPGDVPIGAVRCTASKRRSQYANKQTIELACKLRCVRFSTRPEDTASRAISTMYFESAMRPRGRAYWAISTNRLRLRRKRPILTCYGTGSVCRETPILSRSTITHRWPLFGSPSQLLPNFKGRRPRWLSPTLGGCCLVAPPKDLDSNHEQSD